MRVRLLSSKTFWPLLFISTLLFIGWGDNFLPKPLSNYSRNTRHKIEQFLIGSFPETEDAKNLSGQTQNQERIQEIENQFKPLSN